MKAPAAVLLLLTLACAAVTPASAQKFKPRSIQFKGAPEYSGQELLDAAGLKLGEVLDYAAMNEHSKRMMDTHVFEGLTFKFDGIDLIFSLSLSSELFPL